MHHLSVEYLQSVPELAWQFLLVEINEHPFHVFFDVLMVLFAIYALRMPVHKAHEAPIEKPTKEEEEELLREFESAPFEVPARPALPDQPVIDQASGIHAKLADGTTVINVASFDYLAYATSACVVEAAQQTIVKYGCGSCGPRGFYGSIKPHLDLETSIAKFLGTDNAIIYSYSFATGSTMIPCFTGRGDEIIADESVNLGLQIGMRLSRSSTAYFRHNDLLHLESLMQASHTRQRERGKRQPPRRTIVIEGIYRNTGELCRLPEIVELAKKYKFRVLLDDSLGFAALGMTGRGTPEHFGVPIKDIDFYVGSMTTSLGAVGGFCAGAAPMVDHQRLTATGYVFSASLPPYTSTAAVTVLDILNEDPSRVLQLQKKSAQFRAMVKAPGVLPANVTVLGDELSDVSPVVYFVNVVQSANPDENRQKYFNVAEGMLKDGFMATAMKNNDQERNPPPPSLRVVIKSELSEEDLRGLVGSLKKNLAKHFA